MKFVLGTKAGMTQVFSDDGVCQAATILKVAPATVTHVRTSDQDGYDAVQIATGEQKEHRLKKADKGHRGAAKYVKEFRPKADDTIALGKGDTFDVSVFTPGDHISVSAISKGKGFQGVVKRHGFGGGPKSHGQKHSLRKPGSIGATGFGRVIKGTRMAGRMGADRVTVKNLTVLQVNPEEQLLVVSGAVPGRNGALVEVRSIA